jgi:hypothetical protein
MDKKARLLTTFDLRRPDRPPVLGGWLYAPDTIRQIAGCSEDDYYARPLYWGIEAERLLGSDGMMGVFAPQRRGRWCIVDHDTLDTRAAYTIEAILADIASLPDPDGAPQPSDEAGYMAFVASGGLALSGAGQWCLKSQTYAEFVEQYQARQRDCGDMLWCAADWRLVPQGLWYAWYGYESSMLTLALYPDAYRKLLRLSARRARRQAEMLARAIQEGICPPAVLSGEDLCSQQGPLVSPEWLRREYWPLVEYTIEPLVRIGAKVVWHCDGNCRPIVPDILACGVGGLQGFQPECGMSLEWIADLRTRAGDPLLIFGPMPVTGALRFGTPDDVRDEVRWAMDMCRDRAALAFLTSNTINPDVPLENIRAYREAVLNSTW